MFAMTLTALLLGAAAEPSVADARADKPDVADRLCRRLECTSDQLASIRRIVADTRTKVAAERADDHDVIARLKLEHRKDEMTRAERTRLKAAMKLERMELDRVLWAGIDHIGDALDREQAAAFTRLVEKHGPMFVFHAHGHGKRDGKLAKGERKGERAKGDGKPAKRERDGKLAKRERDGKLAKSERKATKGERRIDRRAAARDFTARHPAKA